MRIGDWIWRESLADILYNHLDGVARKLPAGVEARDKVMRQWKKVGGAVCVIKGRKLYMWSAAKLGLTLWHWI